MATYKTVTMGTGKDYTSFGSMETTEARDLALETGDLVCECWPTEMASSQVLNGSGWGTDSTHRLVINNQKRFKHWAHWNDQDDGLGGVFRISGSTTGLAFEATALNHVLMDGIQIRITGSSSSGSPAINISSVVGTGTYEFKNLLILHSESDVTTNSPHGIHHSNAGTTLKLYNSLIIATPQPGWGKKGIRAANAGSANIYIYNCTFDGWDRGLETSSTQAMRLKNCRFTNLANGVKTGSADLHSASNYNLTDDSAPTNWGANSIDTTDSPTISYRDDSATLLEDRDYTLLLGDSGLAAGTDLSSDSNQNVTDDIYERAREDWDIGSHERSRKFPMVEHVEFTDITSNTTSHVLGMPPNIVEDDLLIMFFAHNAFSDPSSTPSGWTAISPPGQWVASADRGRWYERVAGASEPSTVTVTVGIACHSNSFILRVANASGGVFGEAGNENQNGSSPDPNNLTPAGGSQDFLWLTAIITSGSSAFANAAPAGYEFRKQVNDQSDLLASFAFKEATAASENPGTWSLSSSSDYCDLTLAIAPFSATTPVSQTQASINESLQGIADTQASVTESRGLIESAQLAVVEAPGVAVLAVTQASELETIETVTPQAQASIIEAIAKTTKGQATELETGAEMILRPDADVGGNPDAWVDEGAGTTDIFNSIDEASPSDADWIESR